VKARRSTYFAIAEPEVSNQIEALHTNLAKEVESKIDVNKHLAVQANSFIQPPTGTC
jgi:hypothetical protein